MSSERDEPSWHSRSSGPQFALMVGPDPAVYFIKFTIHIFVAQSALTQAVFQAQQPPFRYRTSALLLTKQANSPPLVGCGC